MSIQADLRQVIHALSDALDLVGIDDVAHGKRVGVMAAQCALALGLPPEQVQFLFDLGLMHDIGVSNTVTHQHLVEEFDWVGSQQHTIIGYELLKDFAPLAPMALPIRYHHTRWETLQQIDVAPEIARQANLILLVDRVDALAAPYYASGTVMQHRDTIQQEIIKRSGTYFDPTLVAVFLSLAAHEAFWLTLEPRALKSYVADMSAAESPYLATHAELRQLAMIFARIVDAKSPFTYTHSRGVAAVAMALAQHLQVTQEQCDKLEIAALLHDLGKLRVPDAILDKPGSLSQDERLVMNAHSFETFQILKGIRGFEDISAWAASHHEAPGGTGYPYGLDGNGLPLEARILRVADIFQAMVQDRPYRKGLDKAVAETFMLDLMDKNRIDRKIGSFLLANMDEMLACATAH
jgi:putative nucleotidyltransferase with HDIG domain